MNLLRLLYPSVLTVAFHERDVRWTLGRRGRVRAIGGAPLAPGTCTDGVLVDSAEAARALAESPGFLAPRLAQVVLALPAQRSTFRRFDVPAVKGKHRNELIDREIRREMPMLADTAYTSWAPIREHDGKLEIFVVGTARDVLDSHSAALRALGLRAHAADLRVIASARAVGHADSIIANVEDTELELAIFRDGIPSIIRHVPMTNVAEDAWPDQVAAELARTLKFYRDSHRDDDVIEHLPVTFVGGAASRAMLSPQVASGTGHEVAMPPLRASVTPDDQTVRFAANVGLALKAVAA